MFEKGVGFVIMEDWIIVLITIFVTFVVVVGAAVSVESDKQKKIRDDDKKRVSQGYMNRAISTLEAGGFCIEKKIMLNKVTGYLTMKDVYAVLFDNQQKKFALIDTVAERCCVMNYKTFVSCEIFCNKSTEISGTDGMALLGGMMFGATGAIVGASAPKEMSNKVNDLKLFIKLNDFKIDHVSFQILSVENGAIVTKKEEAEIFDKVNEVVSAFDYIKNNAKE